MSEYVCVFVAMRMCMIVYVYVRACVNVREYACTRTSVCVRAYVRMCLY